MGRIKIQEVSITVLRITGEDNWMKDYIDRVGDKVETSPHFLYLLGRSMEMVEWMNYRKLSEEYITGKMMIILKSLIKEGQKEPIKIYKDMRINTGHKRAACMLFLGYSKIKALIVPNDFKL